jgi:hypothetical protein
MSSVFADFYNLDLEGPSPKLDSIDVLTIDVLGVHQRFLEEDRKKIEAFFEKHAPEVLRYKTVDDIEALMRLTPDDFDFTDDIVNTLGYWELTLKEIISGGRAEEFGYYGHEESWFDTSEAFQFYRDYKDLRKIVDEYRTENTISEHSVRFINSLGENLGTKIAIKDKTSKTLSSSQQFEEKKIDLRKYALVKYPNTVSNRYNLSMERVCFELFDELLKFINKEILMDKCIICNKLFKKNKSNHVYCSPKCRQVPDTNKKSEAKDDIHQKLCELIDEWMGPKQESEWIDANSLAWVLSEMFSIGSGYQKDLDRGNISDGLRWQLKENGLSISDNATSKRKGNEWLITDEDKAYIIKKEKGELNIYRKTFLLDKDSPSKSIGRYLENKKKTEEKKETKFEDKLKEKKKIIIDRRQKGKDSQEYKFIRM